MGNNSSWVTGQRLFVILGSVLLLQCMGTILTFLYFTSELKQIQETFSKSNMACLVGDILDLHAGPTEDEEFYVYPTRENAEKELCWKFREQVQQLIEKSISSQYEQDMSVIVKGEVSRLLPSLTQSEPGAEITVQKFAAHLTGNYKTRSPPLADPVSRKLQGQKIQTWEPRRGQAFLHSVEYRDGELIIPKTGLYYIYGQTYFRYSEAADSGPADSWSVSRNALMMQYIYKDTANTEPILLMKNTRTTCWAKNREYELHSIYQGGVFQLRYNDKIFVTVSNISWIDMDAGSSFFGAFLVS